MKRNHSIHCFLNYIIKHSFQKQQGFDKVSITLNKFTRRCFSSIGGFPQGSVVGLIICSTVHKIFFSKSNFSECNFYITTKTAFVYVQINDFLLIPLPIFVIQSGAWPSTNSLTQKAHFHYSHTAERNRNNNLMQLKRYLITDEQVDTSPYSWRAPNIYSRNHAYF